MLSQALRPRLLSLLGLALLIVAAVPATAGARTVYVSNGGFAGSNNVSALPMLPDGYLATGGAGPPAPATGGTIVEGLAIMPDARHVYTTAFGTNGIYGFNVTGSNGSLSATSNSPFSTGAGNPLGVAPAPDGSRVFVWNHGTNTIGVWNVALNGELTQVGAPFPVPATQSNPFAGSVSPDGKFLYVPNENSTETVPGCGGTCEVNRVTPYSVAANGTLALIQGAGPITGTTATAGGPNPFGSGITPDGKFLYVANPNQDSLSGYAVNPNDGTLSSLGPPFAVGGVDEPLNIAISPGGDYLYVAGKGSPTEVSAFRINAGGTLTELAGSPFSVGVGGGNDGKALALTPDGKRLYVSNQLTSNVSGFNVAADGSLSRIPSSPWATGGTGPDLESIAITPNQGPNASFTASPAEAASPSSFDGSGSNDVDGTVGTYRWAFGDGTTTTQSDPNVQHVYAQPGTYTARLTVIDNEGCSVTTIFTGKATLCNGSSFATTTRQVVVPAPKCFGVPATVTGSQGDDKLTGTNGPDVIAGLGGNDTIDGLDGNDLVCGGDGNDTASGGAGDDRIGGGAGDDVLRGDTGDDRVDGETGNDQVSGGDGADSASGGDGDDAVGGGAGDDRLGGGAGNDRVLGNPGNDAITGDDGDDRVGGDSGNDRVFGNSGNDRVVGGSGRDRLGGGSGNDRLGGGSGGDRLYGNSGRDRLLGNSGRDRLLGGSGRDRLSGGRARDRLAGGSGRDRLRGDSGNDRLSGNSGNDRLRGGTGNDRLRGGSGRDRLSGGPGNDRLVGGPGRDKLDGGSGRDVSVQ